MSTLTITTGNMAHTQKKTYIRKYHKTALEIKEYVYIS